MATKKDKTLVSPVVCGYHDEKDENLVVEVELPGVKKKNLKLQMTEDGFCASGERDDFCYEACYNFMHEIDADKAKAKFDSGLLTITVPFLKPEEPREITIG